MMRCPDCGSAHWNVRYAVERLDGKGPRECDHSFHLSAPQDPTRYAEHVKDGAGWIDRAR